MKQLAVDNILQILARGAWFSRQPPNLQRLLVEKGTVASFPKGAWIFGASDQANGLFAVLDGSILGYATLAHGDNVLIELAGPGAWFGQISLLKTAHRMVTATAATPAQLLLVPRRELLLLAKRNPALWESFAELSQLQMQRTVTTLAETLALPPRSRVAARLTALIPQAVRKGKRPAEIRLTQAELAEMTGLERKTVHRILKAFETEHLVAVQYGLIQVLDYRGLETVRNSSKA
jgi:CRP/FNR family transcriptional regulator, cyclic AMP receptor protein